MPATMLADYAEYEQAIGLDWYGSIPISRFLLDRYLPDPDDRTLRRGARRAPTARWSARPWPPGPR